MTVSQAIFTDIATLKCSIPWETCFKNFVIWVLNSIFKSGTFNQNMWKSLKSFCVLQYLASRQFANANKRVCLHSPHIYSRFILNKFQCLHKKCCYACFSSDYFYLIIFLALILYFRPLEFFVPCHSCLWFAHLGFTDKYPKWKSEVHPKMKIVIINLPSNCSKPVWTYFFCWTQKNVFWRTWITTELLVPIDLYFYLTLKWHSSVHPPKINLTHS